MAYLGRPSAGDSPFAIGNKAFFDTSSPQPPSQRNPTPRQDPGGVMATPQPYGGGNVSGEARRRYEERYRKKKEEEAAAAAAAAAARAGGAGAGPGGWAGGGPPPMQHSNSHGPSTPVPPGGYPGPSAPPQHQQRGYHPGPPPAPPSGPHFAQAAPPRNPGYPTSPQPSQQSFSSSPHLSTHAPTPPPGRSSFDQGRLGYPSSEMGPPGGQGQGQGRSQSPFGRQGQGQGAGLYSPPLQQAPQGQQRWSQHSSNGPGGPGGPGGGGGPPQWSNSAVPPPSQDWRGGGREGSFSGSGGGGGGGSGLSAQSHGHGQSQGHGRVQSQGQGQGQQGQGQGQAQGQGYGGSGSSAGHGDEELRSMFEQFDSSRAGQLNSYDLQRLLAKDSLMEDPREDAVKMLMRSQKEGAELWARGGEAVEKSDGEGGPQERAEEGFRALRGELPEDIFDTDRSGTINFMEFEGLYRYIQDWHGIFQRFDRDASGLIDRKELHQALLGFGFSLPPEMVRKLEKRFAPPPKHGQAPRKGISFDRFLMACVTVKHYTEGFRRLDPNNQGRINVDYNSFMEMVLDAP